MGEIASIFRAALDERRFLRLYEEADAAELHGLIERNREHLARWMPWAAGQEFPETLAYLRRRRVALAENAGFDAAIVVDGQIVGTVGVHRVDWANRSSSLGYWLSEDAQGQGTMTTAVRSLLHHAFGAWRLNRVEIRAGVENARSRAIPLRLGFTQEGVLRQAERIGDRYIDHAVYAMLAREWAAAG